MALPSFRTTGMSLVVVAAGLLATWLAFVSTGTAGSALPKPISIKGLMTGTVTLTSPVSTSTSTPAASTSTPTASPTPACISPSLWTVIDSPNVGFRGNVLAGVAAINSNSVWAVGYYTNSVAIERTLIENWNGSRWSIVFSPDAGTGNNRLNGIAALSSSDIWAVGYYTAATQPDPTALTLHWNGSQWSMVPSGITGSLNAITAIASDDVWAVGTTEFQGPGSHPQTLTTHWNGNSWNIVPSPNPDPSFDLLFGVKSVGSNTNDVWAVGFAGFQSLTEHWNGQEWSVVPTPLPSYVTNVLWAVDTISSNDVWAVGECCHDPQDPIAFHWDGTNWNDVIAPNPYRNYGTLNSVAAIATNDVWAVGFTNPGGTLIEHWNGTTFQVVPSPPNPRYTILNGVDARPGIADDVWSVGYNGYGPDVVKRTSVLHYGGGLGTCSTPTATPTPISCTIQFLDVPSGSTFYPYVRCLACRNILNGYPDGTFHPNANVTRGQAAKIVSNAAGYSDPIPPDQQTFSDVPPTHTFWLYVERGYAHGVFQGYPCGGLGEPCDPQHRPYFRPVSNLTRSQLAKLATNAAGFTDQISPDQASFADIPSNDPFWIYVERAVAHSILNGYSCGDPGEPCDPYNRPYFRPAANVTRGQTAKIVANTFYPNCQTP